MLCVLASFFGITGTAKAAGATTLEIFPNQPRVGELVTVQLRTFVLLEGTPPWDWQLPLGAAAISPVGRSLPVRLVRAPGNPYQWTGALRFPSRGPWTLCAYDVRTRTGRTSCRTPNAAITDVSVRRKRAAVAVWHRLERPLQIPSIAGGSACPIMLSNPTSGVERIGPFTGTAWGPGPAYPGGLDLGGEGKPVLHYLDPIPRESGFYGSNWFGNKVLWMVDQVYRGPILVRGRQLDGPNELRFDQGRIPVRELRIAPSRPPRSRPSSTRVRSSGCYAYQVDGLTFSYTIVFEAKPF